MTLIPFQIETQRVIQLLARQIYQSPLALLRENTQNAFDAVRQRLHAHKDFEPRIDIQITPDEVSVTDNGIGMTAEDLANHYWKAGSSSKNNEVARAAGVVGTFGIGAMANFGIADVLTVETESAVTGERTWCRAERSKLSLKENCIEQEIRKPLGQPGTCVIASVRSDSKLDVKHATAYIAEVVCLVEVPVYVNGVLISQKPIQQEVAVVPETWRFERKATKLAARLTADVLFILSNNADIWLQLTNLVWSERPLAGRLVLRSGLSVLRTFRSGFGLATASVQSVYQFGGVADLLVLEPTAGREALTSEGLQLLQSMMSEIDLFTSGVLSERDECDVSTPFMQWVVSHSRYDLCGRLKIAVVPGERMYLSEVAARSKIRAVMTYDGSDQAVIKAHSTEETPVIVFARAQPRKRCEQNYLAKHAATAPIADRPVVRNRRTRIQFTSGENALAFRVITDLEMDYFVKADVEFGIISHGLPAVVEKRPDSLCIVINAESQSVKMILELYQSEFLAFGSMVKDFIRTILFPRIADYVPSSTRQGAEAFLAAIRRRPEGFEYALDDLGDLPQIWEDYDEGRLTVEQAIERSKAAVRGSVQVVDSAAKLPANQVVPDVLENERILQNETSGDQEYDPAPAITRLEVQTGAKLLLIDDSEPSLRGYRCFLAITDKVFREMGEFFLQPHRTSIVWGGQKTLFIFIHHSGEFGLYYDLQTRNLVEAPAGGGAYPTATIILRDRLFIPIPDEITKSFVPEAEERKKFDVRADILRTDAKESK